MLNVFIGFDKDETIAFHVLVNSIMRQSSVPVSITPLILSQLPLTRPRDIHQSTDFSFSRFLVPWLCNYKGKAIFLDSDMLFRMDIADLWRQTSDKDAAVSVVQHHYVPKHTTKFLDQKQSKYEKKNWSSLMLFNNEKCKPLQPEIVNERSGMFLHQFEWAESIGNLPLKYNHLVGEYEPNPDAKIVHFTLGTPCFAKYSTCEYAQEWRDERQRMMSYNKVGEYSLTEKEVA